MEATSDPRFADQFVAFRGTTDPLAVSAVVLAVLALGYPQQETPERMMRALTAGSPALTPTGDDWLRAASALAQLGGELVTKSCSFWTDAILAAQCERLGVTLITRNAADFRRMAHPAHQRRIAVPESLTAGDGMPTTGVCMDARTGRRSCSYFDNPSCFMKS